MQKKEHKSIPGRDRLCSFFYAFLSEQNHSASGSFGFPASTNTLSLKAKKATTTMNRPETTMSISMAILSASGPNTSIPKGIIKVTIMLWTPKTRPR